MLKAVVFDFDGVLVDSEPLHYRAFRRIAQRFGVDFTYGQYLERYVGFDDRDGFRAILVEAGQADRATDRAQVARLCAAKARAFEDAVEEGIRAFPGAIELVRELHPRLPLAIASGATRRDIEIVLGKLDLMAKFDPVISADDVEHSKPDPQTYVLAVRGLAARRPDLHIQPQECLAIEDTQAGLEAARQAGLMTLGVDTSGQGLTRMGLADRVLPSLQGVGWEKLRTWYD